jgi:hypothetical protein
MRVKTSELSGAALDWAVAKCEGVECDEDNEPVWFDHDGPYAPRCPYTPSTNWAQGGANPNKLYVLQRRLLVLRPVHGQHKGTVRPHTPHRSNALLRCIEAGCRG